MTCVFKDVQQCCCCMQARRYERFHQRILIKKAVRVHKVSFHTSSPLLLFFVRDCSQRQKVIEDGYISELIFVCWRSATQFTKSCLDVADFAVACCCYFRSRSYCLATSWNLGGCSCCRVVLMCACVCVNILSYIA